MKEQKYLLILNNVRAIKKDKFINHYIEAHYV